MEQPSTAGIENLRVPASLIESIVAAFPDFAIAVIVTDLTGTVTLWNRAAEGLYGWPAAVALGRPIQSLTVGPVQEEQADEILEQLGAGRAWMGQFDARRNDGQLVTINIVDVPVVDAAGEMVGICGLSRADDGELPHILNELQELRALSEHVDEERRQAAVSIAEELHDDINQRIAWSATELAALAESADVDDACRTAAGRVVQELRGVLSRIERLCEQLKPPLLDEIGLTLSLAQVVEGVADHAGLVFHLDLARELDSLTPGTAWIVHRIASEAIVNVGRHAQAGRCTVVGRVVDDVVEIDVIDDGIGMTEPPRGFGTRLMRERARSIGGVVSFSDGPGGAGTRVRIQVPVHQPATDSS